MVIQHVNQSDSLWGCSNYTIAYVQIIAQQIVFICNHQRNQMIDVGTLHGYNHLAGTVAHLCKAAEISGYKTNHSLRATNATWLYDGDVDEQLIMERTGHLSTEGVRSYKRTTKTQQEKIAELHEEAMSAENHSFPDQ